MNKIFEWFWNPKFLNTLETPFNYRRNFAHIIPFPFSKCILKFTVIGHNNKWIYVLCTRSKNGCYVCNVAISSLIKLLINIESYLNDNMKCFKFKI